MHKKCKNCSNLRQWNYQVSMHWTRHVFNLLDTSRCSSDLSPTFLIVQKAFLAPQPDLGGNRNTLFMLCVSLNNRMTYQQTRHKEAETHLNQSGANRGTHPTVKRYPAKQLSTFFVLFQT
jgi:hypothetical protein